MNPARSFALRPHVLLFSVAVAAALLIGAHGPLYWDTFGYLMQALNGDVGGLMLGRPVFVGISYALTHLVLAAGGSVWSIEPVLRLFWMCVSCAAAPLTHRLAVAVGLTPRGAMLAGLAVALSPALAHTSHAVLTDGPALTLTLLSFVVAWTAVEGARAQRPRRAAGLALVAGIAAGLACGVRETAVLNLPILALILWLAPHSARVRLVLVAAGATAVAGILPVAWAFAHQPGYIEMIRAWQVSMAQHRLEKSYGLRDLGFAVAWTVALGPVTMIAAIVQWCREPRRLLLHPGTMAFAVVGPSIAQLIFFGGYLDIAYSPRYLLAALPGALAIPAAMTLDRWAGTGRTRPLTAVLLLVLPVVVAAPVVRARQHGVLQGLRDLRPMTAALPERSVIVTGQMCPGIAWLKAQVAFEQGHAPAWETVCPGWAWPRDLTARLSRATSEQRSLVFDLRETSWVGTEQRVAFDELRRYMATHPGNGLVWK